MFWLNIVITALVVAFASWLSGVSPRMAGFITALPLMTMLVLPMSFYEHQSLDTSFTLAKSIFVALPVTLLFFLPFVFHKQLNLGFWQAYLLGVTAMGVGYWIHKLVLERIT